MRSADQEVACRICRLVLNRYDDSSGRTTFIHPDRPRSYDHDPEPVPARRLGWVARQCDFCTTVGANAWEYRTAPITVVASGPDSEFVNHYGTRWAACPTCADLVLARDLDRLHAQALTIAGLPRNDVAARAARQMMAATLRALEPGRTFTLDGSRGSPPALPPSHLPKVRDRLTRLLDEGNVLPAFENDTVRSAVAAGLPMSRLYAIDPLYTDMAVAAASGVRAASIAALDIPAPYGLLTWTHPVSEDATIAMSWATDSRTIHVATYRALATTIDGPQLQRVREQAGWLLPTAAFTLHPDRGIDGDQAGAVLVATWLLIAHRLTETAFTPVDAPIRRAYARAGRSAPEVRLVHLRPQPHRPVRNPDEANPAGPHGRREPDHRWWVKPFIRNQPHGPRGALRKPILVMPFVNGPAGKPVRASTTVRILAQPKSDTPMHPAAGAS